MIRLATLLLALAVCVSAGATAPNEAASTDVGAQRAIEQNIEKVAPEADLPLETAVQDAENRRAMSNCLTSSGSSADACRQRRPHQQTPMSRARAYNLEDRYRWRSADPSRPHDRPQLGPRDRY